MNVPASFTSICSWHIQLSTRSTWSVFLTSNCIYTTNPFCPKVFKLLKYKNTNSREFLIEGVHIMSWQPNLLNKHDKGFSALHDRNLYANSHPWRKICRVMNLQSDLWLFWISQIFFLSLLLCKHCTGKHIFTTMNGNHSEAIWEACWLMMNERMWWLQ